MRIVVFSGTTEGRDFSRAAAALGIAVTVSVATDLGAEEQGQAPGITVHSGRLLPGAMAELLQGAALCVDATHPYAVEATKNIRAAAVAIAVGPGTASTGISRSLHILTRSSPGSEIQGIPASVTTAQLSPLCRRLMIFSETCDAECS